MTRLTEANTRHLIIRCSNAEHPTRCCYVQRYAENGLPLAEECCAHYPTRIEALRMLREAPTFA